MKVEAVEQQILACHKQAAMESWLRANIAMKIEGRASQKDIERLCDYLQRNRRKEATALVLSRALVDGSGVIAALRRGGVLRASRYGFNAGGIREIVQLLLRLRVPLGLNASRIRYLESLSSMYSLAADARRMRDGLVTRLRARRGIALKSFLVMANQVFANGWHQDRFAPSNQLEFYSVEDISGAVSLLIALHREAFGLHLSDWAYTDAQAINPFNATYEKDLLDALHLQSLLHAEILIDGLPYQADIEDGCVVVRSIDPDLEKSVRLGYVQMEMQVYARRYMQEMMWKQSGEPVSLDVINKAYYENGLENFVEFKPNPLPRIAFCIPAMPGLFEALASDQYFREDLLSLLQLQVDDFGARSLEPFEVAPNIRSVDLFKVNRLFGFLNYVMAREIAKVDDPLQRETLTLNSAIPVMRREAFLALLNAILLPEQAERVMSLLTLDDTRAHVDLQYTPFICVEGVVLIAPALVAHSNLVRNVACANNLQEERIKDDDPMQRAVAEALSDAGFLVGVEVSVSIAGVKRDTDIIAYRDGMLFLFECKNAYHPCNAHEMRNSYDHIKKAGEQLTLRQAWFSNPTHQARLWEKLEWSVPASKTLRTTVLIANRVFTGTMIEGHPVRQAHEFINVILRGEIRGLEETYRIWTEDMLTTADVDRYLGTDGLLKDHFAALKPFQHNYRIGTKTLVFDSWYCDLKHQQRIIRDRYRVKPTPTQGD